MINLLFLILFPFYNIFSDDELRKDKCSTIDYSSSFSKEVYNQKKTSWCYAYATADVLEFITNNKSISASDIAMSYNEHGAAKFVKYLTNAQALFSSDDVWRKLESQHETGFIKIALSEILKKGTCSIDAMPNNYLIKKYIKSGKELKVDFSIAQDDILNMYKHHKNNLNDIEYFYKTNKTDYKDFIHAMNSENARDVIRVIHEIACSNRSELNILDDFYFKVKSRKFFENVSESLENKKIVAIDYFSNFLKDKKYQKGSYVNSLHTSSLVGRRFNDKLNRCEYLIKNSWGSSCEKYKEDHECRKGYVWVSARKLYNQSLVSYLTY